MNEHTKFKMARQVGHLANAEKRQPRGLTERIVWRAIGDLKQFPGNPRQHPECQIARLMKSIQRVWTNPILIDETGTVLAGHGPLEAAKRAVVSVACKRSAFSNIPGAWEVAVPQ